MALKTAIYILSEFYKEAAAQKAEQKTINPQDYCFAPDDENVRGKHYHFPIFDEHAAKRTIGQIKSLDEKPAWWIEEEGEELSSILKTIKDKVIEKVKRRYPKLNIDEIKPITKKKKPKPKLVQASFNGCPNCGFTKDEETGDVYDVTFPCPQCNQGGAMIYKNDQ